MTEVEREVRLKALRDAMGVYADQLGEFAPQADGSEGVVAAFEAAEMCRVAMEAGGETIALARDRLERAVEPLRRSGYCYVISDMEKVLDELEELDREHPIAEGRE